MSAKEQRYSFFGPDIISKGELNRTNRSKIFDWDKAAALIKDRRPKIAEAGLDGDWDYTGGTIYRDGNPVLDDYTYLSSTWANPTLVMDGEEIECYTYDCEWDEETKWPESALQILNN